MRIYIIGSCTATVEAQVTGVRIPVKMISHSG